MNRGDAGVLSLDIDIINEIRKNPNLIKFLRKDPKRGVEYIVKKID